MNKIKMNYYISKHAKERIKERCRFMFNNTDTRKYIDKIMKDKNKIGHEREIDGRYVIHSSKTHEYLVFDYDDSRKQYVLVSFIDMGNTKDEQD